MLSKQYLFILANAVLLLSKRYLDLFISLKTHSCLIALLQSFTLGVSNLVFKAPRLAFDIPPSSSVALVDLFASTA